MTGPVAATHGTLTPPQNLFIDLQPNGSVLIRWQPPADTGGHAITEYVVERLRNSMGPLVGDVRVPWVVIGSTTQTSIIDASYPLPTSQLLMGYRVTAYNSAGESADAMVFGLLRYDAGFPLSPQASSTSCVIAQVSTSPPGVTYDPVCAIMFGTESLPEPHRTTIRNRLLTVWADADALIDKLIINPPDCC